jgi:hypothetical protein
MAGSSTTFGPMMGRGAVIVLVVVGNIRKLATETIQFRLCCIFVSLILPSNLRKDIS